MFTRVAVLTFCLSASLAAQDAAPQIAQENDKEELETLQGDWEHVSITTGGKTRVFPTTTISTIKGDKWSITTPARTETATLTILVNGSKDPKTFDRKAPTGEGLPGIFKLEGDTLTIATDRSRMRPKDFIATETKTLSVYKRVKK